MIRVMKQTQDEIVKINGLAIREKLREEFKFSYIFISHDLSVVKFISDRIVVMNKGEIEEIGYADDIYNNPTKEYTKGLISAIPKGELEDIKRKMSQVSYDDVKRYRN
jgi:peptide/nickel transport system ATP-binding protein